MLIHFYPYLFIALFFFCLLATILTKISRSFEIFTHRVFKNIKFENVEEKSLKKLQSIL